jgi:hypothetical protein
MKLRPAAINIFWYVEGGEGVQAAVPLALAAVGVQLGQVERSERIKSVSLFDVLNFR